MSTPSSSAAASAGARTATTLIMALILALNVPGKPVKMIWSREDDIRNDKLRPLTAQRIEIGLDADNNIVGWRQRIVNESYLARILPPDLFAKIKQDIVSGGGGEMSYAVPNHRVEWVRSARGIDVGAWRGIAAGYTKFAIETMMDEIAALKKMDPLDYRLAMLKDAPRAAAMSSSARRKCQTTRPSANGRAVGIAYSDALQQPYRGGGGSLGRYQERSRSRSIICGRRWILGR